MNAYMYMYNYIYIRIVFTLFLLAHENTQGGPIILKWIKMRKKYDTT